MPRQCTSVERQKNSLSSGKRHGHTREPRAWSSQAFPEGRACPCKQATQKKSCRKRACLTSRGGWDSAQSSLSQSALAQPATWPSLAYCSSRHPSSSHHVHRDICMGYWLGQNLLEAFGRAVCGVVKVPDMRTVKMPPGASVKVTNCLVIWALPTSRDV